MFHGPRRIEWAVAAGIHRRGQYVDIGIPAVKLFREKVVPANHKLAEPRQTPRERAVPVKPDRIIHVESARGLGERFRGDKSRKHFPLKQRDVR